MFIKNVRALPLSCSMENPIMDSFCYTDQRNLVLVKIETDEGLVGYGEAAGYGGSLLATTIVIEKELKPLLIGEDPFSREKIWEKIYKKYYQHGRGGILIGAMSGVDIALWDLIGKIVNQPVYKLLGSYANRIRAYASCGFYVEGKGLKELAEEMKEAVDKGFTAVKMKVGRTPSISNSRLSIVPHGDCCNTSIEEDIERVKVVRETIGNDVDLLLDANNAWDLNTAIKIARAIEKYNIYYIEEPVLTEDREASAALAAATIIPIAGYETAYTRYEFKDLITMKAIDIVQPDVVWSGGITECIKIAAIASSYHFPVIPHSFSSALCLAANLHFVASIPNGEMIELDINKNPFREELIKENINIDSRGYIKLSDKPGLGVTVNEEVIKKYIIDEKYL